MIKDHGLRKKTNCRYSFNAIESFWHKKELNNEINFIKHNKSKYILEMFPYPSGKIHVGHIRNYEIADILKRYYYLNGYTVFRPMGWDAFGLPAENAALENGISPKQWTEYNIKNMKETLQKINYWYDWDYELKTCDFEYYKHQQKLFIDLYNAGFVSKKEDWVNWDPVDQTVLANEQVDENGLSWRSGAKVQKKQISQWFLNISKYSEELLEDLKLLEGKWPEKVISMQKNWIGKKTGFIIDFLYKSQDNEINLSVFTTSPEVVFGCNFLVISGESKIALVINEKKNYAIFKHIRKRSTRY